MLQTQYLLVCLRNRDFNGLGECLATLLELTKDDTASDQTGKMLYDGRLLVPLLQSGDKEASKALLANPVVRQAMQSKDIAHDAWILDIAKQDTYAWLWALEQGWGELVVPRPSVLKSMTIFRARDFMDEYFADKEKTSTDKMNIGAGKDAWDAWLRLASKRNPSLVGYLYAPQCEELEHLVSCSREVSLPEHFWRGIEAFYPGANSSREKFKAVYAGLGMPYGAAEEKIVLGKILGLTPEVADSISLEFEPGQ